jgi:hypothetical protein
VCAVSATVPIAFEPILFQHFGVVTYETIRIWTPRPEISYNTHVSMDRRSSLIHKYHECTTQLVCNEGILIFCNTVDEAKSLAVDLDIPVIHGKLDPLILAELIQKLCNREIKNAVCTSVLGVAFDIKDITHVLQNGCPRNSADHEQQTGRCGRRGKLGWAYTFVNQNESYPPPPEPDYWGVEAIRAQTLDDNLCRRIRPDLALHGISRTCVELPLYNPCDICRCNSLKDGKIKESSSYPAVLVHKYLSPMEAPAKVPARPTVVSKDKPLPNLPEFISQASPTIPNNQTTVIQISTQYSMAAFPSSLHARPPHSTELAALRKALDHFADTCIDCWVHRRTDSPNHSFQECPSRLAATSGYIEWLDSLKFQPGTCWSCGCPQYVHRISDY